MYIQLLYQVLLYQPTKHIQSQSKDAVNTATTTTNTSAQALSKEEQAEIDKQKYMAYYMLYDFMSKKEQVLK